MFTSHYHNLTINEMDKIKRYMLPFVRGSWMIVVYEDSTGYHHVLPVDKHQKLIFSNEHPLEEMSEMLQNEFDHVCEMFDPYIPLKSLCECSLDIRETLKDRLYQDYFNGLTSG